MPTCRTIGCFNPIRPGNEYCDDCQTTLDIIQSHQFVDTATLCPEYTGGSVSYYSVLVRDPISGSFPYQAECGDIIEALGMDFNEGNAFKAIWRKCAARTLGRAKQGYKDGLYDSEKVVYFGERMVAVESRKQIDSPT